MKPYVDIEIELEEEEISQLNELAKEYNMTLNEFINQILKEKMSVKINFDEIKTLTTEDLKNNIYMVFDNEKPIAMIEPKN